MSILERQAKTTAPVDRDALLEGLDVWPGPSAPLKVAAKLLTEEWPGGTLRRWRGSWMLWKGAHWAEAEDGLLRSRIYARLDGAVCTDPGPLPIPTPWQPNRRRVDDVLDALKATTLLSRDIDAPAWLTRHDQPPAGEFLAVANGLLHVPTRVLHPPTPELFNLVSCAFDWTPDPAPPRRWLAFLKEVLGDDDAIELLGELFGYVFSGHTDQQKIALLIGPTRSGKGTIARILTALLGRGHVCGPTLASLGTNFGLSPLLGKSLAVVSDARLGGRADAAQVVERLLSISGEDMLTVDRKHREPWSGRIPARIMVLSNELPKFGDASGAIVNRFVVLRTTTSFLGRENTALTDELLTEAPGILGWALDHLTRLLERGRFTVPSASHDLVATMLDMASPVGAFVREECRTGLHEKVEAAQLFMEWKLWAEDRGHHPGADATFGRNLRAVVPEVTAFRPWAGGSGPRPRFYSGIALLPRRQASANRPGLPGRLGLPGTESGVDSPSSPGSPGGSASHSARMDACTMCGEPMTLAEAGQTTHPYCDPWWPR